MCLRRKKKGRSKVLSGRFCFSDSEAEQRALQFLHIWYSNVNSCSSAPNSNKQNPPDRSLGLPFFFHHKHIASLRKVPSPSPSESLSYWFQVSFAAMFVLNYWLREFLCLPSLIALNRTVNRSNLCYCITKSPLGYFHFMLLLYSLESKVVTRAINDRIHNKENAKLFVRSRSVC